MSTYTDGVGALAGCHTSHAGFAAVRPLVMAASRAGEYASRVGELPWFSTPAAVQARAEQLLGEVARTDDMIGRYAPDPAAAAAAAFLAWRSQWVAFAAQFRAYVAGINWFDQLWAGTGKQIETYAAQIGTWQTQFRDFGGYLPGLAPATASPWKQAAIGVAVGLTVATILWLLKGRPTHAAAVPVMLTAPPVSE